MRSVISMTGFTYLLTNYQLII